MTWVAFALLAFDHRHISAFPNQAGWCPGGIPAVGAPHLDSSKVITTGSLADAKYSIDINRGEPLVPSRDVSSPSIALKTGVDYYIRVAAALKRYKGFLVRLSAPDTVDTTTALLPVNLSQVATACNEPVVGICHFNNELKNFASGNLRVDQASVVYLDVTVVRENNANVSSYFYSRYTVRFDESGSDSPSDTPSNMPSQPPAIGSETPSEVPSVASMPSPIAPSTPSPVSPLNCDEIESNYISCATENFEDGQKQQCEACVAQAFPPRDSECSAYQTNICSALTTCNCGVCSSLLEGYLECLFPAAGLNCTLDCSFPTSAPAGLPTSSSAPVPITVTPSVTPVAVSVPSPSPVSIPTTLAPSVLPLAPSASPVVQKDCSASLGVVRSCFATDLSPEDASTCGSCVAQAFDGVDEFATCDDAQNYTCATLGSCSTCGRCTDEVQSYFNCAYEAANCTIDCSPPPPAECNADLANIQTCFATDLSSTDAQECGACVAQAFEGYVDFPTCAEAQSYTCGAISSCTTCGSCTDEVETYFNCSYARENCSISCDSPSLDCTPQLNALDSCVENSTDASTCLSCLATSLGNLPSSGDCGEINAFGCQVLTDCACQSCTSEIEDWVGCSLLSVSGCNVTCGA